MGIEKIKQRLEGTNSQKMPLSYPVKKRTYLNSAKYQTSFTGAGTAAAEAAAAAAGKPLQKFLLDKMPWIAKTMVKIHSGMGEVQNQIINACGTGLIAPLFIMFNPLSDKDQNTKTYTAMRQPISAILAVGTQAAIVVPFNSMIKKAADIGYLPIQYNSTLFPSDDFIEKEVRKANPGKKFKVDKKNDIDELKDAINEYKKKNYEEPLVRMIEDENRIVFKATDGKNPSTLEMPKEDFKKLFVETIDNIIEEEKEEINSATKNKMFKKLERNRFFHDNAEESRAVIQRLSDKISALYQQTGFTTNDNLLQQAHKDFDKECDVIVKELKRKARKNPEKAKVNETLIDIVKEIKRCNVENDEASLQILRGKVNKIINTIDKMASMRTTAEITDYIQEPIKARTNAIDSVIATLEKIKAQVQTSDLTVKDAQKIINDAIKESDDQVKRKTGKVTKEEMKSTYEYIESAGARLEAKVKSIAKCIADQQKKHAKSNIDGLKRWTGLGVSLAILPLTCWLLNKIYPWVMDRVFPGLSEPKKPSETDEKAEVA